MILWKEEIMFSKKTLIYFFSGVIITAGIIHYWSLVEKILSHLGGAAVPFFIGAAMAYIVNILMSKYENGISKLLKSDEKKGWIRILSLTAAFATFILITSLVIIQAVPGIIQSMESILKLNPNKLGDNVHKILDTELVKNFTANNQNITETFSKKASEWGEQILAGVGDVFLGLLSSIGSFFSTLFSLFMGLIFSIYLLLSKETLAKQSNRILDVYLPKYKDRIIKITKVFDKNFRNFFIGQAVEGTITGALCYIGMLIFGFPYASTISILVGFTALIPLIGPWIGVGVGFIMILTSSLNSALLFIVYFAVLQQLEGNLIYPRVVGKSIGLPGMWVIVAVALGGALNGVLGMLIGVPTVASIYQLIGEDMKKRQLKRKNEIA